MPFSKSYQLTLTKRYGMVAERDAQPSSSIEQPIHFRGFTLDLQKYYYHLLWKATRTRIYNIFLEVNAVVNHSWNINYFMQTNIQLPLNATSLHITIRRTGVAYGICDLPFAGDSDMLEFMKGDITSLHSLIPCQKSQLQWRCKKTKSQEYVLQNMPYE